MTDRERLGKKLGEAATRALAEENKAQAVAVAIELTLRAVADFYEGRG